ncbi:hypothetical protein KJ596_01180 [Patescibacteria group bacterium]|nr:hypothetical protein [Patescibacteria group bacterium]MBU1868132.1 hypothetical protein [Patescibacteria group bacterium]
MPPRKEQSQNLHPFYEELAEIRTKIPVSIIVRNNFIGGLAWGFGTVIGATVLIGLLGFLIGTYGDIPVLGKLIQVVSRIAREGTSQIP